ncbi:cyclin-domain-containing protein [Hortaea werneckii]|nr:cyclin-domain-containing protein [Hortaea werneckii]
MSTLTSHSHSPSPAASPHSTFHIRASPRQRPYSGCSASPRRTANAPAANPPPSASKPPRELSRAHPSPAVSRPYADAGTQYSPEGYPPTAGPEFKVAAGGLRSAAREGVVRKRKGSSHSASPSGKPMSSADPAASASAAQPANEAPGEPQPRRDPSTRTTPAQQPSSAANLPRRDAEQNVEPQEARSTHGHSSAPKKSRQEPGTEKIMPRLYWTCSPKELGVLISNMLMELIRLNDQIPLRDGRLTRFHSRAPPGISVSDYLQRLIQHATLSPPILLSMVYYIDRLCALYPAFTINSLTVHRFLITAATVAAKGLSDSFWTNPTYARIGGIPVSELATLELELLQRVHWKIVPKPEVLEEYYRSLVDRTQGYNLEAGGSDTSSLDESDDGQGTPDDDRMSEAPS